MTGLKDLNPFDYRDCLELFNRGIRKRLAKCAGPLADHLG